MEEILFFYFIFFLLNFFFILLSPDTFLVEHNFLSSFKIHIEKYWPWRKTHKHKFTRIFRVLFLSVLLLLLACCSVFLRRFDVLSFLFYHILAHKIYYWTDFSLLSFIFISFLFPFSEWNNDWLIMWQKHNGERYAS